MEPMVVCALGITVYFGYLTVRDILGDLQAEGILGKVQAGRKIKIPSTGILINSGRLRSVRGLIGADFGLVVSGNSALSVSGNRWGGDLMAGHYGFHGNGRRSRA